MVLLTSVFAFAFGLSGWAVLATGALVASLLAVGASSAVALDEDSKPNAPAATSACVGDATGDMMFSDVSEMHYFRAAINCLAYYGVTIGYGDGNFRPNADVSKEEMVLFMQRAAGIAGADAEAVVGDFAMTGSDPVHRGDMALLIARLLAASTTKTSPVNVTIDKDDGTFGVAVGGTAVGEMDWDYFADSRSSQNRVSDSAASALYELGVANGTGGGNFSPASTVSRGAMAAFITRALAHTSARPEGVTVQELATGGARVSVRDADFRPVANASLDLFSIATANLDRAFATDGSCNLSQLADASGGSGKECEIDFTDPVTLGTGDYDQAVTAAQGGTTLWVWTGAVGDKVTRDSEGVAMVNLTKSTPTSGSAVKVTTSQPMNATVNKFGSTVTVTVQLVDSTGAKNAAPTPAQRDLSFGLTIRECHVTNNADQDNAALTSECTAAEAEDVDTSGAFKLGATGEATFDVTISDPDTNDVGDDNPDTGRVTYVIDLPDGITDTAGATTDITGHVDFSEATSYVATVSVSFPVAYAMVPASGTAGNTAVVSVTDQYGAGMVGQSVLLTRADGSTNSTYPSGDRGARSTGVDGKVRIGYAHNTTSEAEAITATVAGGAADGTDVTGIGTFYWVGTGGASGADLAVQTGDLEKNEIVVAIAGGTFGLLRYDSNDQFTVTDADADTADNQTAYGMGAFEEWLAKDMGITTTLTTTTETTQELTWGGYDSTYSGGVANWTLSGAS